LQDSCEGLSFPSLKGAGVTAVVSTLFVRKRVARDAARGVDAVDGPYCFSTPDEAYAAAVRQVRMHEAWENAGLLENTKHKTQNSKGPARTERPLQVTLAIEGAACLRNVGDLNFFSAAGVKMLSLAWAEGSLWAGGDQSGGDITPMGLELIARLDDLGIIHDVSHLSERAFWTLMERAKGKKIASHSNCRALLPGAHVPERHLSDDQIKALAQSGGIVGVNLFARFLIGPEELKRRRAAAADVINHIEHLAAIAGRRDFVALGSDMESGFGPELMPVDVRGPGELVHLTEALEAAGWHEEAITAFCNRNWERTLASA
jgi:membrane dipeptidase